MFSLWERGALTHDGPITHSFTLLRQGIPTYWQTFGKHNDRTTSESLLRVGTMVSMATTSYTIHSRKQN